MEDKFEKKLRGLAKRLEELIEGTHPQSIYDNLQTLMKSQSDYFKKFDEVFLVKLIFYIYSYKRTKSFELANKMCNQLFFAKLFTPRDEFYERSCDGCGGDGDIECGECYGSGQQDCSNCNGTGEQECTNCGGSGDIEDVDDEGESSEVPCPDCQGKGEYTCSHCDGDSVEYCHECGGNGRESCYQCSGTGEVESEELMYEMYSICSWDKSVYDKCEINLNRLSPAFTNDEFYNLRNNFVRLHYEEDHDELDENLNSDNYYCFFLDKLTDNDYLDTNKKMQVMILGTPNDYIH
jgi:hypothetical protein